MQIKNRINHICFVLDASGSMQGRENDLVRAFDTQIARLAKRSKEMDQETRVSVYFFSYNYDIKCIIYDKDVLRLPSLSGHYQTYGQTALIDATAKAITDLEQTAQLYGDHSFLVYVITDGQENNSKTKASALAKRLQGLPENWTLGVLVPDELCVAEAKKFGFAASNIRVWDTTVKGMDEVDDAISKSTEQFFQARQSGQRGVKNLFQIDTTKLDAKTVKTALQQLSPSQYSLLRVSKERPIKEFVESWKLPYVQGCAYYQLSKPEKIQNYKQVAIQEKATGKIYSGDNARNLLGLPDYEVKVSPADHVKYNVFIQSTSTNRKLVAGTNLLVMK